MMTINYDTNTLTNICICMHMFKPLPELPRRRRTRPCAAAWRLSLPPPSPPPPPRSLSPSEPAAGRLTAGTRASRGPGRVPAYLGPPVRTVGTVGRRRAGLRPSGPSEAPAALTYATRTPDCQPEIEAAWGFGCPSGRKPVWQMARPAAAARPGQQQRPCA
jgi:hypothetical protein